MLRTAARFHNYSLNNLLLIDMQYPRATRVAGFQTWKGLGRHVMKGQKGIRILAPMVGKETQEDGTDKARLCGFPRRLRVRRLPNRRRAATRDDQACHGRR